MIRRLCVFGCATSAMLALYSASVHDPWGLAHDATMAIVLAIVVGTWREVQP